MKYKRNTERAIELGRKIMALLDKNSLLFLEYERSARLAEGIYLESTYRIGVEEGIMQYKKSKVLLGFCWAFYSALFEADIFTRNVKHNYTITRRKYPF